MVCHQPKSRMSSTELINTAWLVQSIPRAQQLPNLGLQLRFWTPQLLLQMPTSLCGYPTGTSKSRCPNQNSLEQTLRLLHPHPLDVSISTCSTDIQAATQYPLPIPEKDSLPILGDRSTFPENQHPLGSPQPASSLLEWDSSEVGLLHHVQEFACKIQHHLPIVITGFDNMAPIGCHPSVSLIHFPTSVSFTFQINFLHSNPCLRIHFWEILEH